MPIVSTYCKKGGVGKTTLLGYLAHYYALKGHKVLILSADDQNSIFKLFGSESFISENDNNYLEHYLAGNCKAEDIVCEARENMYIIKTLNTDKLSFALTVKRQEEKHLVAVIDDFKRFFDYIFVDFPPSSSRLSEILLDVSDNILLVIGLDTLGLDGYINTLQYFSDSDIDWGKITHIIPTGYHPIKIAPNKCLKILKDQVKQYTPNAILTKPVGDKSVIRNLQADGISVFDEHEMPSKFHEKNRNEVRNELQKTFDDLNLEGKK